jgi:hypothetical protein
VSWQNAFALLSLCDEFGRDLLADHVAQFIHSAFIDRDARLAINELRERAVQQQTELDSLANPAADQTDLKIRQLTVEVSELRKRVFRSHFVQFLLVLAVAWIASAARQSKNAVCLPPPRPGNRISRRLNRVWN